MSFKDLYEKYINNQASEEEIKIVEEEIEKNEIISEYLCNKIDDDLFNLGNSKDGEDFGEKQQINSNKKCEEDVLLKNINTDTI